MHWHSCDVCLVISFCEKKREKAYICTSRTWEQLPTCNVGWKRTDRDNVQPHQAMGLKSAMVLSHPGHCMSKKPVWNKGNWSCGFSWRHWCKLFFSSKRLVASFWTSVGATHWKITWLGLLGETVIPLSAKDASIKVWTGETYWGQMWKLCWRLMAAPFLNT